MGGFRFVAMVTDSGFRFMVVEGGGFRFAVGFDLWHWWVIPLKDFSRLCSGWWLCLG